MFVSHNFSSFRNNQNRSPTWGSRHPFSIAVWVCPVVTIRISKQFPIACFYRLIYFLVNNTQMPRAVFQKKKKRRRYHLHASVKCWHDMRNTLIWFTSTSEWLTYALRSQMCGETEPGLWHQPEEQEMLGNLQLLHLLHPRMFTSKERSNWPKLAINAYLQLTSFFVLAASNHSPSSAFPPSIPLLLCIVSL